MKKLLAFSDFVAALEEKGHSLEDIKAVSSFLKVMTESVMSKYSYYSLISEGNTFAIGHLSTPEEIHARFPSVIFAKPTASRPSKYAGSITESSQYAVSYIDVLKEEAGKALNTYNSRLGKFLRTASFDLLGETRVCIPGITLNSDYIVSLGEDTVDQVMAKILNELDATVSEEEYMEAQELGLGDLEEAYYAVFEAAAKKVVKLPKDAYTGVDGLLTYPMFFEPLAIDKDMQFLGRSMKSVMLSTRSALIQDVLVRMGRTEYTTDFGPKAKLWMAAKQAWGNNFNIARFVLSDTEYAVLYALFKMIESHNTKYALLNYMYPFAHAKVLAVMLGTMGYSSVCSTKDFAGFIMRDIMPMGGDMFNRMIASLNRVPSIQKYGSCVTATELKEHITKGGEDQSGEAFATYMHTLFSRRELYSTHHLDNIFLANSPGITNSGGDYELIRKLLRGNYMFWGYSHKTLAEFRNNAWFAAYSLMNPYDVFITDPAPARENVFSKILDAAMEASTDSGFGTKSRPSLQSVLKSSGEDW